VTHPIAGPSTATEPDFPAQNTMTLEKAMEELRQGNILPEMEKMGTVCEIKQTPQWMAKQPCIKQEER